MNLTHRGLATALLFVTVLGRSTGAGQPPRPIELWPNGAPGTTGTTDEDRPAVTPYLPEAAGSTGCAVLICPGGGFMTRAVDHEGVLIARWFQERGIAGFILRYRVMPAYTVQDSVKDARRGMRFVRAHAAEYQIDPRRIGMIGFSAGAALAARANASPLSGPSDTRDPLDRIASRSDFQILAYGSGAANPMARREETNSVDETDWKGLPPTFLFGTTEDSRLTAGMVDTYSKLLKAGNPVEAHFFARGVHGVGFAQGDPVLGQWPGLMLNWMKSQGFLTNQARVPLSGVVKIDGQPLARGHVVFIRLDRTGNEPPVVAYVTGTGPTRGSYELPAEQGPIPGRYRVEIRQASSRFMSNSRDPVFSRMAPKHRDGTLTEAERKEWIEYARKRDLSPSVAGENVFGDLTAQISAGKANRIDFELSSR